MVTREFIRELAEYAMAHSRFNLELSDQLISQFNVITTELELSFEDRRTWLKDIAKDLQNRHQGFTSPYDFHVNQVTDEVNHQLTTTSVRMYTLIPVQGLNVSMDYTSKIKVTGNLAVRKIAPWEKHSVFQLMYGNDNGGWPLPEVTFECVSNIAIEDIMNHFNDDEYFNWVLDESMQAAVTFQIQHPIAIEFPWMIQYVPECNFLSGIGRQHGISLKVNPSNRTTQVFYRNHVMEASILNKKLTEVEGELKRRLDVALRRFHDSANKLNQLDRIVDHWIVVESLFGDDREDEDAIGTTSRKIIKRLVSYLFEDGQDRRDAFIWVAKHWYRTRCTVVHGSERLDFMNDYSLAELSQELLCLLFWHLVNSNSTYDDIRQKISQGSGKTNFPSSDEMKTIVTCEDQTTRMDEILHKCYT